MQTSKYNLHQELHENDRALHALHKEAAKFSKIIRQVGSNESDYWAFYLNTFSWHCFMHIILINISKREARAFTLTTTYTKDPPSPTLYFFPSLLFQVL